MDREKRRALEEFHACVSILLIQKKTLLQKGCQVHSGEKFASWDCCADHQQLKAAMNFAHRVMEMISPEPNPLLFLVGSARWWWSLGFDDPSLDFPRSSEDVVGG